MKQQRRRRRIPMTVAAALPDVPHLKPRLIMLDREDCLRIHRTSCEILHRTGVRVYNRPARELLAQAGAQVEDNLVKIPPSLVEWALASAPSQFNLYRRGSAEVAIRLDGQGVYFGPGSDTLRYLDPRSGERRDYQLADLADCARLVDALPEIGFMMSVGIPRDVPNEVYYRYQFATMLGHTTKPIVFVCDNRADMEAIAAMAAATAGGYEALAARRICCSIPNRVRRCSTRAMPPRNCSSAPSTGSRLPTHRHR